MCNVRDEMEEKLTVTCSLTVNLHVIVSLLLFSEQRQRAVLGRPASKEEEVVIEKKIKRGGRGLRQGH